MTTTTIKFTKMHGAGNDYIYVNTLLYSIPNPELASIKWSAPHTGIGSDGLVLIGKPSISDADFSMRIFNADGSEALMCGNASRCIGKYLYEKGITDKKIIRLQTLSGIKVLNLHIKENLVSSVTVDMLEPQLSNKDQLCTESGSITEGSVYADGKEFKGTFVSMGNPHFVIFVEDIDNTDVPGYGSLLEHNALFPQRCNIEFAEVKPDGTIRTRVWERGSGITMACGTGACATAVAASLTHRTGRMSSIVMDGGTLDIEWNEKDNHVYMTGPAAFAFEGEIELPTECDINNDKLNKQ
ncbi:diaminopimelate epimerase [Xylanibacter oryzae]|uniref:diaminopimelate epimerase n=1 Tax=Xylanibacter oryzae TaxID=185293 RepID=UPI0004AF46D2|nr:diaminopimelate epimerase [Xylanibacter oryzae]